MESCNFSFRSSLIEFFLDLNMQLHISVVCYNFYQCLSYEYPTIFNPFYPWWPFWLFPVKNLWIHHTQSHTDIFMICLPMSIFNCASVFIPNQYGKDKNIYRRTTIYYFSGSASHYNKTRKQINIEILVKWRKKIMIITSKIPHMKQKETWRNTKIFCLEITITILGRTITDYKVEKVSKD